MLRRKRSCSITRSPVVIVAGSGCFTFSPPEISVGPVFLDVGRFLRGRATGVVVRRLAATFGGGGHQPRSVIGVRNEGPRGWALGVIEAAIVINPRIAPTL
jgi:hypothetical protein